MNKRLFHIPENTTPQVRNAFRITLIGLVASITTASVYLVQALQFGNWQLYAWSADIWILALAVFASLILVQRNRLAAGIWVLVTAIALTFLVAVALIEGTGLILGVSIVILVAVIVGQTLPSKQASPAIVVGTISGTAAIFMELFLPAYRLPQPALIRVFLPVILCAVILLFGYITVQQFRSYLLRTKLIIVSVLILVSSITVIAALTTTTLRSRLSEDIGNQLKTLAGSKSAEIGVLLDRELDVLKALKLDTLVQEKAISASQTNTLSAAEIDRLDQEWKAADAAGNNNDKLVAGVVFNDLANELRMFQKEFPQHAEIFLTDKHGVSIASTNRTSDYYQADEQWWQLAYQQGLYIGQPEYDASSGKIAMIMALPVEDKDTGEIVGVLRTTVDIAAFTEALASGQFHQTGHTDIYLPDNQELSIQTKADGRHTLVLGQAELDSRLLFGSTQSYLKISHDGLDTLASQSVVGTANNTDEDSVALAKLNWHVVSLQDQREAFESIEVVTRNILLMAIAIIYLATLAAIRFAEMLSGPITRLNLVANKVASGDLSVEAKVESGDETGTLAKTFNSMTMQLRSLIGSLEQRVADRTKALAASAEVSRRLSTILDKQQLVMEVVEQIKAAFDYYHVHIYLLDQASGDLIMAGGTGDAGVSMLGSGHKIPKGKGLVGRAAGANAPVLVSDTTQDPDWLPNPLLPETKSEAAVPIAAGDKVLGVLDVQHNTTDGLKQDDIDLLQTIASQVAIALQNAQSYTEAKERADREEHITTIGQKIQSTTSVESALQTVARELGRTLGANDLRVILEAPGLAKADRKQA